jgi:hypothetical protein
VKVIQLEVIHQNILWITQNTTSLPLHNYQHTMYCVYMSYNSISSHRKDKLNLFKIKTKYCCLILKTLKLSIFNMILKFMCLIVFYIKYLFWQSIEKQDKIMCGETSIGHFLKQNIQNSIGWALKPSQCNIQSNWAHQPVSLSLSLALCL